MKAIILASGVGKRLQPLTKNIPKPLIKIKEKTIIERQIDSLVKCKINDIINQIKKLVEFYPKHIQKQDKNFFIPAMVYFSRKEQYDMLDEFWEFDRKLIHEKYRKVVELYE